MRKLATLTGVAALAAALLVGLATSPANAQGNQGFGVLEEPNGPASWLIDHYDNRSGQLPTACVIDHGFCFDDSADVKFVGTIVGIGKVTVEQSAAWTFNTYRHPGGNTILPSTGTDAAPCALVYDTARTLVRIHTHSGVTTDPLGGLGPVDGVISTPLSAGDVTSLGTHTFTGTFAVTKKNGKTITGVVEGGTNCEVQLLLNSTHAGGGGAWATPHTDTHNTVQTALEITGGTAGETGTGVLAFMYDTFEPHNLLHAHIVLDLD